MTRNTPSKTPLAMSLTENALDFVFSIVTVAMNIMHIFTVTKGWTAKSVLGAHSDDNLKLQSEWFTRSVKNMLPWMNISTDRLFVTVTTLSRSLILEP